MPNTALLFPVIKMCFLLVEKHFIFFSDSNLIFKAWYELQLHKERVANGRRWETNYFPQWPSGGSCHQDILIFQACDLIKRALQGQFVWGFRWLDEVAQSFQVERWKRRVTETNHLHLGIKEVKHEQHFPGEDEFQMGLLGVKANVGWGTCHIQIFGFLGVYK